MVATDPIDALADEHDQFDRMLTALKPEDWAAPSAAAGWTVADVVLHLTQSEELVSVSAGGDTSVFQRPDGVLLDDLMAQWVAAERGTPWPELLRRWQTARTASVARLRECPRGSRLSWAALPLSPRTLATTRIAEHWAHALDIADPLGLDYPDTDRLWHIAWLAQRTLPYAFAVAGQVGGPVRCELTAPSGATWTLGDPAAPSVIRGPATEFCRVGAQRLDPNTSTLTTEGPHADAALQVVRNYAV